MSGFCSVVLIDPAITHLDRTFTYADPEGIATVGSVVRVPFHGRRRMGVVADLLSEPDIAKPLPVAGLVGPGIGEELVALARWVAGRYLSTVGEAIAAALPQRVASEESVSTPVASPPPALDGSAFDRYPRGAAVVAALRSGGGSFVWQPQTGPSRADAIVELVAAGCARGGVLVLVPEVRVSSDVSDALQQTFGDSLARLGSDRSARERYRDWLALRDGRKRIAIGGRAAVFAPIVDPVLIVIDDEGHQSYKEGRAPRYHARAVAAERARRSGATFVLVGVPPSIEARAAAQRKPYILVAPSRNDERANRPPVTLVESGTLVPGAPTMQMCKRALDSGTRAVFITHRSEGAGSVVERIGRVAAPKRLAVLDSRSSATELARAIRSADCIVATPFIVKDLTIDRVGLLAILEADAALAQPEYRAVEDAFATWWRAGRWIAHGKVVLETATPDHPAMISLARWDPDVLYRAEAARRRELGYPPFAALARIDVPGERAAGVVDELAGAGEIDVLGPVEKEGHTVIVARARTRARLLDALGPFVARWRAADEPMRVDVDPWEVLVPKWRS